VVTTSLPEKGGFFSCQTVANPDEVMFMERGQTVWWEEAHL